MSEIKVYIGLDTETIKRISEPMYVKNSTTYFYGISMYEKPNN